MSIDDIIYNSNLATPLTKKQKSNLKLLLDNKFIEEIKFAPVKRIRDSENRHRSTLKKAISLMHELGDPTCASCLEMHLDKFLSTKKELITERIDEVEHILKNDSLSRRDWEKLKPKIKSYFNNKL